jgi:CRP/FNR family transcriptional regulator, cyclic AMP receptor protein
MEPVEQLLAEHPFLQGLAPHHLRALAGCASTRHFAADQFLAREGEEVREFYLVRSGRVVLEVYTARRGAITIQTRREGDSLGWICLPAPYYWNFDIRALDITRTIVFRVDCLTQACEADPVLGYELLKRFVHAMAHHFKSLKLQMVDLVHDL